MIRLAVFVLYVPQAEACWKGSANEMWNHTCVVDCISLHLNLTKTCRFLPSSPLSPFSNAMRTHSKVEPLIENTDNHNWVMHLYLCMV